MLVSVSHYAGGPRLCRAILSEGYTTHLQTTIVLAIKALSMYLETTQTTLDKKIFATYTS